MASRVAQESLRRAPRRRGGKRELSPPNRAPEATREGDAAAAEVRALSSLQANKVGGEEGTRKMAGVQAMLERKRTSHEATWADYGASRKTLEGRCEEEIGQAVGQFKEDAETNERQVLEVLGPMLGDQLGALSLDDIQRIWTVVAGRFPDREALIARLGTELESVEQRRVAEAHRLLERATEKLMDIAHLTRGPIERLVEEESLALNQTVLTNRQAHADLLARLKTREVAQQATWRDGWEADLERWRLLRMRHTLGAFCARMASAEFADPPERNAELGAVKREEEEHVSHLQALIGSLRTILPPAAFGVPAVDTWQQRVLASLDSWQATIDSHQDKLRKLEEELKTRADGAYEQLVRDVKEYEALPEAAAVEQLEREAKPLLEQRRQAAGVLLRGVAAFSKAQAEKRAASVKVLTEYVMRVAAQLDEHKARVRNLQSGIRETVSRGGAAFDDANRAREDAFALCCARIGEGVDEADLDAKVAAALAALARIEEGYRAYHAETTGDVEAYPDAMNSASAAHRTAFEGLLEVKQGASERAGSLEIQANKSGGIVVDSQAGKHAAAATALYEKLFVDESKAKNTSDTSKETPQGEGSASQTEEVKTNPVAPEKKEADQLKRAASKKEPAKKVSDGTKTKAGGKVTPAPVVTPEPTASPPVASSPVPTGDPTPEKSATEPAGDTCPVGVDGQPYLSTLLLSRESLTGIIADLQAALLAELAQSEGAIAAEAAAFHKAQSEQLTTDLDARLRKHRPRAGPVEEELRSKRSAELQKQRQAFVRHARAAAQLAADDQAAFDARLDAAAKKMAAATEKLGELEESLEDLTNLPGVQVKIREAEHVRRVVHGVIDRTVEDLESAARSSCEEVKELNQRFASETFKPIAEGGTWLPEAIAECARQLAAADASADEAEGRNFDRVAEARKKGEQDLADAHDSFKEMVAPHKEDLAFLEHAESAFASTKNRFAEVLESSTAAAQQIQDALAALSALLSARAAQTPNPEAAVARDAAASEDDASTSGAEIRKSPEMSVRAIAELDRVRNLMVPRARFLNCLKSDVPGGQITLSLDEASGSSQLGAPASGQMDPPKIKATGDGKGPGKTSPEAAKKGATKSGGKTTPAGGKKRVSTDREAAEAEEFDTSTLTGQIKKLLSDCRTKLGDACREYYAKLEESDREPTRGARILEDAAAMAELHERTLAQIEWEGEEHRGAAVTRLRAQVITLTGLLAQLPAAVFDDLQGTEVAISGGARARADHAFAARLGELAAQRAAHKFALRPGAARPAMAAAFGELKEQEKARAESALAAIVDGSRAAAAVLVSDSRAFGSRLTRCTEVLLALFDGLVLPEDLEPPNSDGDEIMSMQRKSLKQLLREQRHVAQNPAATSPAPVSSAEPSVRPYGKRTWPGVPTDALDVKQVGWKEKGNGTETEEKVAAEPSVEEAKKTAEKPATQKEKGAVAKGGKPPAKGAADVGGFKVVAGRKNSSGTPDPTDGATSTDAGSRPVEGLDTPFHHAIVRARDRALEKYSSYLASALAHYSQRRDTLAADEADWAGFWAAQCRECQLAMQ